MDQPFSTPRARMRASYLRDETEALAALIDEARLAPDAAQRVECRARELVEKVRSQQKAVAGMQSFLREFATWPM